MSLSDKQIAAAHRLGQDVCVVAGPGSGKTSVLIERFSWLVTERNISPHRILAITFTEKAATEIKQRMTKRFEHDTAMREQIERAYVSTVHAFCARLLRENAITAAVDPQFEVLDWARSNRLLREVADEVLESIYETSPERMRKFLRSLAVATERDGYIPDLAQSLMDIYEAMRIAGVEITPACLKAPEYSFDRLNQLLGDILSERPRINTARQTDEHAAIKEWARELLNRPDFRLLKVKFDERTLVKGSAARTNLKEVRELAARLHSHLLIEHYAEERKLILESLQQIDRLYRQRKRAISAVDFDDLEEFTIRLLESNQQLCTRVRNQFDFILMDELQDTNPLQWKLLRLIRRENNFFAVGDVNQSIFGFRHAEPELFLNYRRQLQSAGKEIDELRDNYRTLAPVLDTVNKVFDQTQGIEPHALIALRRGTGIPACVIAATAETTEQAQRIEAQTIAAQITELVAEGQANYRDIAILARANAATGPLQAALDDHNVPSIVLGGLTLFDTREIRDLVLLLAVIVNPRNEIALAGALRSPLFGITDEELFRRTLDKPLSETPLPPVIEQARELRNAVSPDRLLRRILDATDYESGLSSRARANIEKFLGGLRHRYESNPAPLATILREIESAAPDSEAPPADFGDAVRLMTIHKSKGLEFPVVFLPFLHTSRGTGFPIVSYSHEYGLGVKWRDPHTREGKPDAIYVANKEYIEARQSDEDNRVLYVGMTRAKDRLTLSFSDTKYTRGEWARLIKSKLPTDLTVDSMPTVAQASRPVFTSQTLILTPPTLSGQFDSTASVTDLSVFRQCPRKYYLSRYLRFRDTAKSPTINIGNQTHALLAGQTVEDVSQEALKLAETFRSSELYRQSAQSTNKHHEYDFVFALDDMVLRGQIDLWYEHKGELVIVDYKTDRTINTPPYELQLQIYALALERAIGRRPTRACLHFLRSNTIVDVDVSPLALNAAKEVVRDLLQAQETLDFPLRIAAHCHRCDYYGTLCPATAILPFTAPQENTNDSLSKSIGTP